MRFAYPIWAARLILRGHRGNGCTRRRGVAKTNGGAADEARDAGLTGRTRGSRHKPRGHGACGLCLPLTCARRRRRRRSAASLKHLRHSAPSQRRDAAGERVAAPCASSRPAPFVAVPPLLCVNPLPPTLLRFLQLPSPLLKSTFLDGSRRCRHYERVMHRTACCACCRTGCCSGPAAVRLAMLT